MEITDLTDGEKYRVVTIDPESLSVLAALHAGVLERGKEDLAKRLNEKLSSAKNFNDVQAFLTETEKALNGAGNISKLLVGMIKQMERNHITEAVRMLLTKPELDYFTKLAELPVNADKAVQAGFSEEQVKQADEIITKVRNILSASETPTETDIKVMMTNSLSAAANGNIFNPPVGKA